MGKRYGATDPGQFISRDVIRRVTRLEKALLRAETRIRNQNVVIAELQRFFNDD